MTHDHDDDSLHAGCAGCIEAAKAAAWSVAPLREVTWVWSWRTSDGKNHVAHATSNVRVPDGATPDEVDEWYVGESINGLTSEQVDGIMAWSEFFPAAVEIGPVVSEADAGCEQESLL